MYICMLYHTIARTMVCKASAKNIPCNRLRNIFRIKIEFKKHTDLVFGFGILNLKRKNKNNHIMPLFLKCVKITCLGPGLIKIDHLAFSKSTKKQLCSERNRTAYFQGMSLPMYTLNRYSVSFGSDFDCYLM